MESDIIGLVVALLLYSFFAGGVSAFVSVDKLRFEVERKSGLALDIMSHFLRNPGDFISAMLVGKNLALVVYVVLMVDLIGKYWLVNGLLLIWAQIVVSVVVIQLVGEGMSRLLFKINPDYTLRVLAIPLFVCYALLCPVSKLISGVSAIVLRLFGVPISKDASDKAFEKITLNHFIQSSLDNKDGENGEIDTEMQIFQNALDFSNIKIRDCMVHRTEIVSVDTSTSLEELKNLFVESGISKIIVYDGDIDHVVGYIHSSEMFRNPHDWRKNVKEVPIVPETMGAHKLMKLFMQQKKTIAVVVDEFGGTTGIVSLEDLVEEIFGEIEDEHDNSPYICKKVDEHEYLLSARLEIDKVNEAFDLALPESDDYMTIGGLILNHYQSFPKLHEEVTIGKFLFKIVKVTATKIELVRLKVLE